MEPTFENVSPAETPEQTIARLKAENAALKEENAALKEENARLNETATKDSLTGAYNLRGIKEILRQEVAATARGTGNDLLIIYFDLDHFKQVNDTYGHLEGDIVLKRFVEIIKNNKRETDSLGRIGGEEFVLIAPTTSGTNRKGIEKMLERYLKEVKTSVSVGGKPQTVSIGCAILHQKQILTSEQVKKAADEALYTSKNEGRDRFTITDLQTAST